MICENCEKVVEKRNLENVTIGTCTEMFPRQLKMNTAIIKLNIKNDKQLDCTYLRVYLIFFSENN